MVGPDSEGPPTWFRPVIVILLVATILLATWGLVLPMATFNVNTNLGITSFVLDSEWKAGSVEYTGAAPEMDIHVEGSQDLLDGMGEFQEKIGFIKGTSKTRTNYIIPYTDDPENKYAQVNVTVRAETIPWWVVGVAVPCEIEVELVDESNISSLTIDRVYFQFHRVVDGVDQWKEVWAKEVSDPLAEVGARHIYKVDLEATADWGKFDVFGMVEVTMVDSDGLTATREFGSWSTEPMMITLWTIPTSQGVQIALLIVAMPVLIIGLILAAVAVLVTFRPVKGRLYIVGAAATMLLLGSLFFYMGLGQLTDVVGYPDDLEFLTGFSIMVVSFVPALIAGVLMGIEIVKYTPDEEKDGPSARAIGPDTVSEGTEPVGSDEEE